MSWLKSFWSSIKQNYGNLFQKLISGDLATSLVNKYTEAGLTGAQQEQNAFNAQEAQKTRDWETEMSNTAYQRQVADMQAAGVNPALMYGGAGSSGASTPSGATASGSVSGGSDILPALFQFMLGKKKLGQDYELQDRELGIRQYEAETRRLEVQSNIKRNNAYIANLAEVTRGLGISNDIAEGLKDIKILQGKAVLDLTNKQIEQIDQGIEESSSRIGLLIQQTTSEQMKSALYSIEARLKELEAKDKAIFLLYADKLYQSKGKQAYYDAEQSALEFGYSQNLLTKEYAQAQFEKLKAEGQISKEAAWKDTLLNDLVRYTPGNRPAVYKNSLSREDWRILRNSMTEPFFFERSTITYNQ